MFDLACDSSLLSCEDAAVRGPHQAVRGGNVVCGTRASVLKGIVSMA
jgi:hypothetical protein